MIVISYGLPKTGSTLAFEMARAVLEANGHPQRWLGDQLVEGTFDVNFVTNWSDERLTALIDATRGEHIVLKTHRGKGLLTEQVLLDAINAGDLRVHVVIRDPRDTVASMIDSVARDRANPEKPRLPSDVPSTIARLGRQLEILRWWGGFPCLELRYEQFAFDRACGPKLIADDLGMTSDVDDIWQRVDQRFTQFNVGRPERYKTDLWPEEVDRVERAFPLFLDVVRGDTPLGWFWPHR